MQPKLSVLIATLGRRYQQLDDILNVLLPQVKKFKNQIEVIVYVNNGKLSIGEYRQTLLETAKGDYICFVDDDDDVPDFYCEEIINAMGKDYIGFNVKFFSDGQQRPPVYHSLKYDRWSQDANGFYRNITHLNPVRRELALKGTFHSRGGGEDETWATQIKPFVKTENYINKDMYFYYHNPKDSFFANSYIPKRTNYPLPLVKAKQIKYIIEE